MNHLGPNRPNLPHFVDFPPTEAQEGVKNEVVMGSGALNIVSGMVDLGNSRD